MYGVPSGTTQSSEVLPCFSSSRYRPRTHPWSDQSRKSSELSQWPPGYFWRLSHGAQAVCKYSILPFTDRGELIPMSQPAYVWRHKKRRYKIK